MRQLSAFTLTPYAVTSALHKLSFTILPLPKFDKTEIILVSPIAIDPAAPAQPNLPPLVTFPHGGPHATTTSDWNLGVAGL